MVAALVLVLLLLTARFSMRYGVAGGVALALVGGLWLVADKPMEGPTLVRVTQDHGLASADVVGLVAIALGVAQVISARRRR